jgi:hypothetical protein
MFTVEYDCVWCYPSHSREALAMLRKLTKTEIMARGIEGMRGLRVNVAAPMPADSSGRFDGAIGAFVMRNFLGSLGLSAMTGEVSAGGAAQRVRMADVCRKIEVLAQDDQGKSLMVGGIFIDRLEQDHMEVMKHIPIQQAIETNAKMDAEIGNASYFEVLLAKLIMFVLNRMVGPVIRALSFCRVARFFATVFCVCLTLPLAPAGWFLKRCKDKREDRRWEMLSGPFDPIAEAQSAMSAVGRQGGSRARIR